MWSVLWKISYLPLFTDGFSIGSGAQASLPPNFTFLYNIHRENYLIFNILNKF